MSHVKKFKREDFVGFTALKRAAPLTGKNHAGAKTAQLNVKEFKLQKKGAQGNTGDKEEKKQDKNGDDEEKAVSPVSSADVTTFVKHSEQPSSSSFDSTVHGFPQIIHDIMHLLHTYQGRFEATRGTQEVCPQTGHAIGSWLVPSWSLWTLTEIADAARYAETKSNAWLDNISSELYHGLAWPASIPVVQTCQELRHKITIKSDNARLSSWGEKPYVEKQIPLAILRRDLGLDPATNGLAPLKISLVRVGSQGFPVDIFELGVDIGFQSSPSGDFRSWSKTTDLLPEVSSELKAKTLASSHLKSIFQVSSYGALDALKNAPLASTGRVVEGTPGKVNYINGTSMPTNQVQSFERGNELLFAANPIMWDKQNPAHFWLGPLNLRQELENGATKSSEGQSDAIEVSGRDTTPGQAPSLAALLILDNLPKILNSPADAPYKGIKDVLDGEEGQEKFHLEKKSFNRLVDKAVRTFNRSKYIWDVTDTSQLTVRFFPRCDGGYQAIKSIAEKAGDPTVFAYIKIELLCHPVHPYPVTPIKKKTAASGATHSNGKQEEDGGEDEEDEEEEGEEESDSGSDSD